MEYYRRVVMKDHDMNYGRTGTFEPKQEVPDSVYVERMIRILSAAPCLGVPPDPSNILGHLYLGTSANAENLAQLKANRITYLLNCAGTGSNANFKRVRDLYPPESGIMGYQELILEDTESANARHHFERAHAFIEHARDQHGNVLIYCNGVSRSGAVTISYLMKRGRPLLQATKIVKEKRRCALTNESFMCQLVEYARDINCLDPDVEYVRAPKYFRPINRYRINSAHLPTFV